MAYHIIINNNIFFLIFIPARGLLWQAATKDSGKQLVSPRANHGFSPGFSPGYFSQALVPLGRVAWRSQPTSLGTIAPAPPCM